MEDASALRRLGLGIPDRTQAFGLAIVIAFAIPYFIPRFGLDYPYLFIMMLVLGAWFIMKWDAVKALTRRGNRIEQVIGGSIIAADYAENTALNSRMGLVDMIVIFSALVIAFYGVRSFKLFWVPATYGIVLLLGYQLENAVPNYVALQDWMAGLMASSMHALGVTASVSGHVVTLNTGAKALPLDVESDCTGIQGVLAFGMLSTMGLLDLKPRLSRVIPIFTLGFMGAFLINIARLILVFVTFEFLGEGVGESVHVFAGYFLFIVWVLVFWVVSLKYLGPPRPTVGSTPLSSPSPEPPFPSKI